MVTGDVLYHLACNIYKKGFCVPYESELNYSEGCILSCTLSAFISSSKCHCFSWSMFPLLKPQWDMCNCCILATCTCNSLLSACPRDKHYACQASYLDHKQTNRGAAWKQGGHPPHPFPDLLPIGSHCFCGRGWEGGGPHRVCVDSNWVRLPVTAHTSMAECFWKEGPTLPPSQEECFLWISGWQSSGHSRWCID